MNYKFFAVICLVALVAGIEGGNECWSDFVCLTDTGAQYNCKQDMICCLSDSTFNRQISAFSSDKKCCQYAGDPVYNPAVQLCDGTTVIMKSKVPHLTQCGHNSVYDSTISNCVRLQNGTNVVEPKLDVRTVITVTSSPCRDDDESCCAGERIPEDFLCSKRGRLIRKLAEDDDSICGQRTFNSRVSYCGRNTVVKPCDDGGCPALCGGEIMKPHTDLCCNGVLKHGRQRGFGCCGVNRYNKNREICCVDNIYSKTDNHMCFGTNYRRPIPFEDAADTGMAVIFQSRSCVMTSPSRCVCNGSMTYPTFDMEWKLEEGRVEIEGERRLCKRRRLVLDLQLGHAAVTSLKLERRVVIPSYLVWFRLSTRRTRKSRKSRLLV